LFFAGATGPSLRSRSGVPARGEKSNPAMTTLTQQATHEAKRWVSDAGKFLVRPAIILKGYQLGNLRPDLLAGVTVAVVMLPQAIAYALIADLPPQMGLYTAIITSSVSALWGSSSHLRSGPTNPSSLLVLSVLTGAVVPGTPEYLVAAAVMGALAVHAVRRARARAAELEVLEARLGKRRERT